MKKIAVFSVLALGMMMLVGAAATPAHAVCITLTNFCDTVQLSVDPGAPQHVYGKWDWVCVGVGTSVYGSTHNKITVGTRMVYGTYTFAYTADFIFNKSNNLFDLVATDGNSTFFFQNGQPWSSSPGSCGLSPHKRGPGISTTGR